MLDTRGTLDTLIQGSTVDLFHSFSIAVAPVPLVPRERLQIEQFAATDLLGSISFAGRGFTGALLLSVPEPVFALMRQEPARPFGGRDWIREATNQLLGRIKSRIAQFQIPIHSGLPSTPGRDALERLQQRSTTLLVYVFRTLRGRVCVSLGGDIDHTMFVYAGAPSAGPSEGDIILF